MSIYVVYTQMRRNSSYVRISGKDRLRLSAESLQINPSIDTFGKILLFYLAQARDN